MSSRFRFSALLVGIVAMLALAPTAFAKGGTGGGGTGGGGTGGGGGGGTCATLNSFSATPGANGDFAGITTTYSVFNGCVDEFMANIDIAIKNEATGFVGTSVVMASYGLNNSTTTWRASYSTPYTITISVWSPNGKLQATQSQRVTTPGAAA